MQPDEPQAATVTLACRRATQGMHLPHPHLYASADAKSKPAATVSRAAGLINHR